MHRSLSFSELLKPLTAEEFFEEFHGKTALQLSGRRRRFAPLFSWSEFNRLLNMTTLWSQSTMKVILDGRELTAPEYCQSVRSRNGSPEMQPDSKRINMFLDKGATVVLDLAERLSEGLAAFADTLQVALGAPVSCNIYCSWEQHRGFPAHFDTMDVFALQIDGEKIWKLYEGRFNNPIEQPGYNYSSLPRDHHEATRGKLLKESVMTPGDVLYIPRGQYHEALASKNASLHLSFGVTEATGIDFLNILLNSLSDDPLFRTPLPHFDKTDAHIDHLAALAGRLKDICAQEDSSTLMRNYQKRRAFRYIQPGFSLPQRANEITYRVRTFGVKVTQRDSETTVECDGRHTRSTRQEMSIIDWIVRQALFTRIEAEEAFPATADDTVNRLLDELEVLGLIESI